MKAHGLVEVKLHSFRHYIEATASASNFGRSTLQANILGVPTLHTLVWTQEPVWALEKRYIFCPRQESKHDSSDIQPDWAVEAAQSSDRGLFRSNRIAICQILTCLLTRLYIFGMLGGGVRGSWGGDKQFVTHSQVNMFTAKSQTLCIAPVRDFKTFVMLLIERFLIRYFTWIINGFESAD